MNRPAKRWYQAADADFAADPDARLAWVMDRAGERDPFRWTYPVRREL